MGLLMVEFMTAAAILLMMMLMAAAAVLPVLMFLHNCSPLTYE
jgi:hypothetical protein